MVAVLKLVLYFYSLTATWATSDPLPKPVASNAVAGYRSGDNRVYFSFMGMGPTLSFKSVTRDAYAYTSLHRQWTALPPVPGRGRIGAQAYSSITGVLLFGGTAFDEEGKETTVPDVNVFVYTEHDPTRGYWSRGVNIPVPVADAAIGALDEYHTYLIGGWSNGDAVSNVQLYNPRRDRWEQATPLPGRAVFGHAGTIVDNYIICLGGAYKNLAPSGPKFLTNDEAWLGKIDRWKPTKIEWTRLPPFPSMARFGIAAGAGKHRAIFVGGSEAPYDYTGMGYNGQPAIPLATAFAYNVKKKQWETLPDDPRPTLGNLRLINDGYGMVKLGGMTAAREVTNRSSALLLEGK